MMLYQHQIKINTKVANEKKLDQLCFKIHAMFKTIQCR